MASSIAAPDEESTGEETTSEESEVVILDSDHRKQLKAINKMAGRTMGVRLARTQSLPEPVVSVSPPHRPTFIGGLTPRTLEDEVTKGRPFLKNSAAEEGEERSSLLTHAKGRMTGKRKTIDQDLSAQSEPRMKRASKEKSRPTVVRKSKRTAKIVQVLPEEQQLFRGLSFFFLPNDDVGPLRRMRIHKAIEYGATWVREFKDGVTHIIADRRLTYQDVVVFLKIASIPTGMVLVTETFTVECVRFRCLLGTDSLRFQLPGAPSLKAAVGSPTTTPQVPEDSVRPASPKPTSPPTPWTSPPRHEETSDEELLRHQHPHSQLNKPESQTSKLSSTQTAKATDEDSLQQAIDEAKQRDDLWEDSEGEGGLSLRSIVEDESDVVDGEDEVKAPPLEPIAPDRVLGSQSTFSCMHKHDMSTKAVNPNARTMAVLEEMCAHYTLVNDSWRTMGYRKAISALRRQTKLIASAEEAKAIPSIGSRLAQKIEEIVRTDQLRRLENAKLEPLDQVLKTFTSIYGVGYGQAQKWVAQGHRTLDDLLDKVKLTENQRVGVLHHDDFSRRIPRAEVECLANIITAVARTLDAKVQVHLMGSYRRGATDCGDVDLIITKPHAAMAYLQNLLFKRLIPALFEQDIFKVTLVGSGGGGRHSLNPSSSITGTAQPSGTKWHGAGVLPRPLSSSSSSSSSSSVQPGEASVQKDGIWRRIDILLVPDHELGAALLYFTGNDVFNRSIRLLARKKGMRLNQHGLWNHPGRRFVGGGGGNDDGMDEDNGEGRLTLLEGRDERRIFDILGVPWRNAHERNV